MNDDPQTDEKLNEFNSILVLMDVKAIKQMKKEVEKMERTDVIQSILELMEGRLALHDINQLDISGPLGN